MAPTIERRHAAEFTDDGWDLDQVHVAPADTEPAGGGLRERSGPSSWSRRALAVLAAWVGAVVLIGGPDGFVAAADVPPWRIVLAVALPLGVFVALFARSSFRHALVALDPRLVVAAQLWRVVGAAFLFGWATGELDAGFAIPAGIGDIATGVAALGLLGLVQDGTAERRHVVAFTALGVGDFAIAVVTGAMLRPDGLEEMPWVLFPALAVPLFAMAHLVTWVQLSGKVERHPPEADRVARVG